MLLAQHLNYSDLKRLWCIGKFSCSAEGESVKILIIDNSVTVRKMVAHILEEAGHTTTAAENGLEGLEYVLQENYDLIITNINMPKMDGYEFIKNLKQDPATEKIPVIILTSETKASVREIGEKLGISDYLTKPVVAEKLLESIQKLTIK